MNVPSQFPYFVACMSADRPLGVGSLQGKMSAIMSETPSEPADSARVWCQRLNLNDPPSSTSVGDDLEMVRHMGDRCENAGNWKYHMKMRNTKIKTENARCENDGLTFLPPPLGILMVRPAYVWSTRDGGHCVAAGSSCKTCPLVNTFSACKTKQKINSVCRRHNYF